MFRWGFAAIGSLAAQAYPTAYLSGIALRHSYRCRNRVFSGAPFDDCFNDYLPIFELLWAAVSQVLAIIFIHFAFRFWAKMGEGGWQWFWAKPTSYGSYLGARHYGLGLAILFCLWQLAQLPWHIGWLNWLQAYWLLLTCWFAVTLFANWPISIGNGDE